MTIRFDRLNQVIEATEKELIKFAMNYVHLKTRCGTVGCMIGNYNQLVGRDKDQYGYDSHDHDHFGITNHEYHWLFDAGPIFTSNRFLYNVTKQQALSRLRKFIAYKRLKHEFCYDEKYGITERARKAEGNQNFISLVKEERIAV